MKKLTLLFAVLIGWVSTSSSQTPDRKTYTLEVEVREGLNSITLPDNKGTLKFISRQDKISNLSILDKTGKTIKLAPQSDGATEGNPNCPCGEYCYEDEVGMRSVCMCASCSSGGGGGPTPKSKRIIVLQSS